MRYQRYRWNLLEKKQAALKKNIVQCQINLFKVKSKAGEILVWIYRQIPTHAQNLKDNLRGAIRKFLFSIPIFLLPFFFYFYDNIPSRVSLSWIFVAQNLNSGFHNLKARHFPRVVSSNLQVINQFIFHAC